MSQKELDKLLHQVATIEGPGTAVPDDQSLAAYRSGRLSTEEAHQIEELLAQSSAARRRMIEIAALETKDSSTTARRHVSARFGTSGEPGFRRQRWKTVAALATAVAAAGILAIGLLSTGRAPLPETLSYEVSAFGLATSRATPEASALVQARSTTVLRVEIAPRGLSDSEVEFGIYRQNGNRLQRLRRAGPRELEASQGAATFRATASELLGDEPGTYELLIAIARPGNLPLRLTLDPGSSALERLSDGGRRRVYLKAFQIVSPPEPESFPANGE